MHPKTMKLLKPNFVVQLSKPKVTLVYHPLNNSECLKYRHSKSGRTTVQLFASKNWTGISRGRLAQRESIRFVNFFSKGPWFETRLSNHETSEGRKTVAIPFFWVKGYVARTNWPYDWLTSYILLSNSTIITLQPKKTTSATYKI